MFAAPRFSRFPLTLLRPLGWLLVSESRLPPIHLFLLDDISSLISTTFHFPEYLKTVKSRPVTSDTTLCCCSNLWVCTLKFDPSVVLLCRELLNYADSTLKISKCDLAFNQGHWGEGWVCNGNLEFTILLHGWTFGCCEGKAWFQDEKTGRIYI